MTASTPSASASSAKGRNSWSLVVLILGILLLILFQRSFQKGQALLSNDGPLAVQVSEPYEMPGAFFGIWNNLYWLGAHTGNFSPDLIGLMLYVLGPKGYTNFHIVVSLLILGLCSWFYFRVLGFRTLACVLGALAAALNMNFFSNAGWGLSSRALSLSMTFLALAAVRSSFRGRPWVKTILAGLAVGMSILEGGDNGAIFSMFVAAYAVCLALIEKRESPWMSRIGHGVGRVALMAVCAALLAAQSLNLFVDVAVKGIVGAQQDTQTKEQQWNWATQWSLPKIETLRVIIPGLYGYRMDTPDGGQYWGSVGRSPNWEPGSAVIARYSGAGEYAGILVVLVGIWALAQAGRRNGSVFTPQERSLVLFWAGAALVALVFAWGRHAPFYQLLYALPYFSTIRNPMKFMHPFHMTLMVLFAYGLQGLCRQYLGPAAQTGRSLWQQVQHVWAHGPLFERRWMMASVALTGLSVLFYVVYAASRPELIRYLTHVGFGDTEAQQIARFSAGEVGMFILFLALSAAAVCAVQSGWLAGRRAVWAGAMLGLILVVDLVRADTPWIIYYNYEERYASNPVIDVLKDKPYEHRVVVVPFAQLPNLPQLQQFYNVEWLQHHFQFYNIQALDVAQEPRLPADKAAYLARFTGHVVRYWQLTNVRYLLGLGGSFVQDMNQQLAPAQKPFRLRIPFTIRPNSKGFFDTVVISNAPFSLIEMTNTLPRARLYPVWEANTNQEATLNRLVSPEFDPTQSVLVAESIAAPPSDADPVHPGSAQIVDYSSRTIRLQTQSEQATVLLLNDRYHPAWQVSVDGQRAELLRCNFIMRGVQLPPGEHQVTFQFHPPATTFFVTLAAVLFGLLLCAYLAVAERKKAVAV